MEHRLQGEWQPTRPCSICCIESRPLMWAIPAELLGDLSRAWGRVGAAAANIDLNLRVGA